MNWEQVLVALAVGIPSLTLGILAYRRSREVDAVSEKSGIASDHRAGTAQVIEGLRGLIEKLEEDNDNFRADVLRLTERLDTITKERDALRQELSRLQKKYGVNGNGQ